MENTDGDGNPDSVLKRRKLGTCGTYGCLVNNSFGRYGNDESDIKGHDTNQSYTWSSLCDFHRSTFIGSTTADTSTLRFPQPLDQIIILTA